MQCISPLKKGRSARVLNQTNSNHVFSVGECKKKDCVSKRENLLVTVADLRTQLDGRALVYEESQETCTKLQLEVNRLCRQITAIELEKEEQNSQLSDQHDSHLQAQEEFRTTNANLQLQVDNLKRENLRSEVSSRKLRSDIEELNVKMAQQLAGSVRVLHDAQAGREELASQIFLLTGQLTSYRKELEISEEKASTRDKELTDLRNSEATLMQEVTELRDELTKQKQQKKPQIDAHLTEEPYAGPISRVDSPTGVSKTRKILAFTPHAPVKDKGYTSIEVALILVLWSLLLLSPIGGWLWVPDTYDGHPGPRAT